MNKKQTVEPRELSRSAKSNRCLNGKTDEVSVGMMDNKDEQEDSNCVRRGNISRILKNNGVALLIHCVLSFVTGLAMMWLDDYWFSPAVEDIVAYVIILVIVVGYVAGGYFCLKPTLRHNYLSVLSPPCSIPLMIVASVLIFGEDFDGFGRLTFSVSFRIAMLLNDLYALIFGSLDIDVFSPFLPLMILTFPSLLLLLGMQLKKRRLAKIAGETASLEDKVKLP